MDNMRQMLTSSSHNAFILVNNWEVFWQLLSPEGKPVCSSSSWGDEFTDTGQGSFLPSFILKTEYTASALVSVWQQKPTNWAAIPPQYHSHSLTILSAQKKSGYIGTDYRCWQKVKGSESFSFTYAKILLDVNIISSHRHNKLRHHLDGNSHWAIFPAARNLEIRLHPAKASRAHYTQGSLFHPPQHSGDPASDFHSFHHLLLFITAPSQYF